VRAAWGRPPAPPPAGSASGRARRKGEGLARMLRQHGVTAQPSARRYLEACGQARMGRAVLSASASTVPMLELAHLAGLIDTSVDAAVIRSEELQSPPAPDLLLAACRRLGVAPHAAVSFTHNPAGIVGARAAGVTAIGVAAGADADLLQAYGAKRVVAALDGLLERGPEARD